MSISVKVMTQLLCFSAEEMLILMSIKIRKVTRSDFDGVLKLNRNFYKEAASDRTLETMYTLKGRQEAQCLRSSLSG